MLSRSALFLISATALLAVPANAQQTKHRRRAKLLPQTQGSGRNEASSRLSRTAIATLTSARTFEQVAISPDAKNVAWVESLRWQKWSRDAGTQRFIFRCADGSDKPLRAQRLKQTAGRIASRGKRIAWSPDSSRIAFLSDAVKPGQPNCTSVARARAREKTHATSKVFSTRHVGRQTEKPSPYFLLKMRRALLARSLRKPLKPAKSRTAFMNNGLR